MNREPNNIEGEKVTIKQEGDKILRRNKWRNNRNN